MNNKTQTVINIVLALAVVALFILHFACRPASKTATATVEVQEGNIPVAFLNVDSLLLQYTFAQEAQEQLMKKQEDARLKLNTKARTLQQEMADFQQKYENNAFLSRERAQSEYQRLQNKQQELEELEAKLTQDIMLENQTLNLRLADSLQTFLGEFNADGRFHIILSNNAKDNVLMANEGYDITAEVVNGLNARYHK